MIKIKIDEYTFVYRPEEPDRDALNTLYDVLNNVNKGVQRNACSILMNKTKK